MSRKAYTVDEFKKILDSLSDQGFGSMPILLGTSAPLLEDSICINYLENKLRILNLYYDKQLVDAVRKLKTVLIKISILILRIVIMLAGILRRSRK